MYIDVELEKGYPAGPFRRVYSLAGSKLYLLIANLRILVFYPQPICVARDNIDDSFECHHRERCATIHTAVLKIRQKCIRLNDDLIYLAQDKNFIKYYQMPHSLRDLHHHLPLLDLELGI